MRKRQPTSESHAREPQPNRRTLPTIPAQIERTLANNPAIAVLTGETNKPISKQDNLFTATITANWTRFANQPRQPRSPPRQKRRPARRRNLEQQRALHLSGCGKAIVLPTPARVTKPGVENATRSSKPTRVTKPDAISASQTEKPTSLQTDARRQPKTRFTPRRLTPNFYPPQRNRKR